MTQKELLYVEDAIGHENNIIQILNEYLSALDDDELSSFINEQIKKHKDMKQKLMNVLEDESNE